MQLLRRALAAAIIATALVAIPPSAPASAAPPPPDGFVFLDSESGDPGLAGAQFVYATERGTTFQVDSSSAELVQVAGLNQYGTATVHLALRVDGGIAPGTYTVGPGDDDHWARISTPYLCLDTTGTLTVYSATRSGDAFTSLAASFEVACQPGAEGLLRGQVRVNSSHPVQGRLVHGDRHLGTARIGEATAHTFTIENPGRGVLTVTDVDVAGSTDFSIGTDDCSGTVLVSGADCDVVVHARPSTDGLRTADLVISDSIAPGGRHLPISVAGQGSGITLGDLRLANTIVWDESGPVRWYVSNYGAFTEELLELNVVGGDHDQFFFEGGTCVDANGQLVDLPSGSNCYFDAWATPTRTGIPSVDLELVTGYADFVVTFRYEALPEPYEPYEPYEPDDPVEPETPVHRTSRNGYWMVDTRGIVYAFGDARHYGNAAVLAPAVDVEADAGGNGYWVVDERGFVYAFGGARHFGSVLYGSLLPGERVTSISATRDGEGYWLFTSAGRVFPKGNAPRLGDMSGRQLNGPVLDSVPTPSGNGYYMVASDGGIFTFGDAVFRGSMGGKHLNKPVQSLVPDADGWGYWLVASDGGIFAFDAPFHGSMGSQPLNKPITGMVGFDAGYLMVGEDGGIFSFGEATFRGSLGASPPPVPVVSVATLIG